MTTAACSQYLHGQVKERYLTLLASRWAALLPRLAKQTQRLQADYQPATIVEDDFGLAEQLLEMEHEVYRAGTALLEDGAATLPPAFATHFGQMLHTLLTGITVKETMVAHWRSSCEDIPADTLRVYCHYIISSPMVPATAVDRLLAFVAGE